MTTWVKVSDTTKPLFLEGFAGAMSMDAILWLEEHVGTQAVSILEFEAKKSTHSWVISFVWTCDARWFGFKSVEHATLFKMTWC